jgi:hypothetical protein
MEKEGAQSLGPLGFGRNSLEVFGREKEEFVDEIRKRDDTD